MNATKKTTLDSLDKIATKDPMMYKEYLSAE